MKKLEPIKLGSHTQREFTITPSVLRQYMSEILNRIYYCDPPHVAHVLRRGKVVATITRPIVK